MQSCEDGELQQRDGWDAQKAHLEILSGRAWPWPEPSSLYIRVTIFITAGPDVRATTKPAPSGHRRVIVQLPKPHPRRRSLGAPSSGAERGGCGKCWPPCAELRASAIGLGRRTSDNIFHNGALLRGRLKYLSAGYMWVRTKTLTRMLSSRLKDIKIK